MTQVAQAVTAARIVAQYRPVDVPRVAYCLNCGTAIYSRPGDTHNGYAHWRHFDNNTRWCTPRSAAALIADPDLLTLEWIKRLDQDTADGRVIPVRFASVRATVL